MGTSHRRPTPSRSLHLAISLLLSPFIRHTTAQSPATTTIDIINPISTSNSSTTTASTTSSSHFTTSTRSSTSSTTHTSTFSDYYPSYTNNNPSPTSSTTTTDSSFLDGTTTSYYYIFIAIFIVACIVALWASHRRKRLRRLRRRNGRQTALLQDAAGWPNNRRWIHGNRAGTGELGNEEGVVDGSGWHTGRHEGLDERGEAPPPYKPANEIGVSAAPVADDTVGEGSSVRDSGEIAVPAAAAMAKPPEYDGRRG